MTTRALRRLTTPIAAVPNLDGLHLRVDPAMAEMTIGERTACEPTLWADDLSTPGPTLVTWTASGQVPAGSGYTYMDPASICGGSTWWVVRASARRTGPGAQSGKALCLEFLSPTSEWRSLIRSLPAGFTLPLTALRRRRPPLAETLIAPQVILLGEGCRQFILWSSANRAAGGWTADVPSCADAIRRGSIRPGELPNLGPSLSSADVPHLRRALAAISQHLVTTRLYGL